MVTGRPSMARKRPWKSPLERQKLFQGGPALLDVCGENHLPHVVNAVPLEEHVFRAA